MGEAMQFAFDHIHKGPGDRPGVKNLLALSIDANSDDDITEAARAFRRDGVLVIL